MELDHVLICAPVGAIAADRLVAAGFVEGAPNRHPGQGTANRRFFFDNAFLEFIWVEDERETQSDLVAPTRLWQRWNWRETGVSPFGICLRLDDGESVPFDTFDYSPPYVPEGASIPIAAETTDAEPMVFVNQLSVRPAELPDAASQPLDHPNGVREMRPNPSCYLPAPASSRSAGVGTTCSRFPSTRSARASASTSSRTCR